MRKQSFRDYTVFLVLTELLTLMVSRCLLLVRKAWSRAVREQLPQA